MLALDRESDWRSGWGSLKTHSIATGKARLVLALVALVATGLTSVTASAADYRQIVLKGHTMKWGAPVPGTGATVTYAVVTSEQQFAGNRNCQAVEPFDTLLAANGIAAATFDHELAAAFAAWSAVADIRFRRIDSPDADILVGAEATPSGRAFTNVEYSDPGQAARRASLARSVICLDPAQPWKVGFDGNLDVYDLRYALTHEIGHAIGLDHPGRIGELMDFRYREEFRVPQAGDIAGATFLYGPSPVLTAAVPGFVQKVKETTGQQ